MGDIAPSALEHSTSPQLNAGNHRRRRENKWSEWPPRHKCGICWYPIDPQEAIIEERATGENDRMEQWLYCKTCWDEMVAIRKISANNGFPDAVDDFEPALTKALGNRTPPTNGCCSRLGRFLTNQLNLDSKLKFLLHLDHCMRCREQVYQATKTQHRHYYKPSQPRIGEHTSANDVSSKLMSLT